MSSALGTNAAGISVQFIAMSPSTESAPMPSPGWPSLLAEPAAAAMMARSWLFSARAAPGGLLTLTMAETMVLSDTLVRPTRPMAEHVPGGHSV
jgi:hypothetical protein